MQLLNDLVGRKVTIFSIQGQGERQDVGVLESTDNLWMKLRKGDNEVMYFCAYHVRLIKPFDAH